ncbi:hypothetical protein [Bacillus sp. NPDC094106]|uniref:hypothetical protein n=1 Tax=Bacillus sp. NPDC094106 TaxID=3363949 RepID=UPI0037F947AB
MTNRTELTCVEFFINKRAVIEYDCNSIPRRGEIINIHVDDIQGEFQVTEVKHNIRKMKDGKLNTYVQVFAK